MGDFKVGVSVGVYCTKCTPNSSVNTNFEIANGSPFKIPRHWMIPCIPSFCQDFKRAGISRLLKEKGSEQFWARKGNLCCTRKNGQNFTPFRVNKMFSYKF
jgi:hypothetical protein